MREEIIDAAIRAFSIGGLKFTMTDVARSMGISKKTIYTIFNSKEEVLEAIADRYFSDFVILEKQVKENQEIDIFCKINLVLCALPDKYHNIGLNNLYGLRDKYPKVYARLLGNVYKGWESVEGYIQEGIRENIIRKISVPVIMAMIEGTVKQFMDSSVLVNNQITYEEAKKEMAEIIIEGIKEKDI